MARTPQDITEAELAILQVLWEQPKAPIRQIAEALYPKPATAQYSTVQKQLERMEAKGFVRRDRSLFVHQFSASVDRDELIGRRLRAVACYLWLAVLASGVPVEQTFQNATC